MSRPPRKPVMSVFNLRPNVVGGLQLYAAELSRQLAAAGRDSVLVFIEDPTAEVATLFQRENTRIETLPCGVDAGMATLRGLARLLRRYRPEMIHFHLMGIPVLCVWLARAFAVVRVFVTDHSSRPIADVRMSRWGKRLIKRLECLPVSKVVCVSDYVLNWRIHENVFAKNRLCRVYDGVDLTWVEAGLARRAEFRRRLRIPDDRPVILQASWLIPEKGIDDLLAAARIVLTQFEQAHFVFAGDGPCRREYEQKARQLGIDRSVTFTGVVTDPLGEGLFAAADIVCQPSRWQEAFGLTIAEAMASGRPVIGTRVGAIPELIVDGETGYLVDRGDVAAIAERIVTLAHDTPLRESLGQAGQRRCQRRFGLTANVAALVKEYGIHLDPRA